MYPLTQYNQLMNQDLLQL